MAAPAEVADLIFSVCKQRIGFDRLSCDYTRALFLHPLLLRYYNEESDPDVSDALHVHLFRMRSILDSECCLRGCVCTFVKEN